MSSYDFQLIYDSFFGGVAIVNNLFATGILVLTLVARGFMFSKANEPAWATVVPFYNLYVLYKIAGKTKLFAAYLVCYIVMIISATIMIVSFFAMIIAAFGSLGGNYYGVTVGGSTAAMIVGAVVVIGLSIAMMIFNIFMSIGLSKSFGKGGGFACGLIFLPVVFYCIIAFSKNIVYRGPGGGQIPPQGMNNYGGQQTPPPPYMGQSNNNQVNHFMSTSSGSSTLTIRYR